MQLYNPQRFFSYAGNGLVVCRTPRETSLKAAIEVSNYNKCGES
jgi:hypothetical protein